MTGAENDDDKREDHNNVTYSFLPGGPAAAVE